MFMAEGCEIANAPMWKAPEYCRAPLSHAEVGADAESPTQCLGWADLDAVFQPSVYVPRGPNPAQISWRDASPSGWPGCARSCVQVRRTGKHTRVASVHG